MSHLLATSTRPVHQPSPLLPRLLRDALIALFIMLGVSHSPAQAEESFLSPEQAFVLTVQQPRIPGEAVELKWTIAAGYYLYRDRIEIATKPSGSPIDVVRPPGEQKNDPNFGSMEVYHDAVTVQVKAPTAQAMTVTWQGCAEAGLCYPPQTQEVALEGGSGVADNTAIAADNMPANTADTTLLGSARGNDSDILGMLERRSLAWTLPLFFLLGIALAFTPCVLPMVPIVSSIVVGQQATPRRAFALSLAFVLPMAATYALLGLAAAMAGANLQAVLQNRWTLFGFGAVFVVLALGMFGFFTIQLPTFLRERLDGASRGRQGGTFAGAAGMGTLSALLVGPCMTAPLAGTLLYIAQSGNALQGALLLLALGLGMGVPLLVVGTLGARYLPRPGLWMDRVKGGFGFLLLGTAIWMVQRVVPDPVVLGLWGALLVTLALTLFQLALTAAVAQAGAGFGSQVLLRSAAALVGLWGGAMVLGAAGGAGDPSRPLAFAARLEAGGAGTLANEALPGFHAIGSLAELDDRLEAARAAGQPVLVDFYADWCVSCKKIEKEVFGDPRIHRALAGVVLLRADVTANNAAQVALMRKHQVVGPPTVMLFDTQGLERRSARLVGEFTAEDLIQRQPSGQAPQS